jgi:hypothetical protein
MESRMGKITPQFHIDRNIPTFLAFCFVLQNTSNMPYNAFVCIARQVMGHHTYLIGADTIHTF